MARAQGELLREQAQDKAEAELILDQVRDRVRDEVLAQADVIGRGPRCNARRSSRSGSHAIALPASAYSSAY